jgi:hypothetical protein
VGDSRSLQNAPGTRSLKALADPRGAAGVIASSKGRAGFGYFVLGLLLPLIGVLIAIGVPSLKAAAVVPRKPSPKDLIACHACEGARLAASKACPHCKAPKFNPVADMKKCPSCAELIKRDANRGLQRLRHDALKRPCADEFGGSPLSRSIRKCAAAQGRHLNVWSEIGGQRRVRLGIVLLWLAGM